MRKVLATMLAAVTVMGSLAGAGVSPAEARMRYIPHAGGGHAFAGHALGGHAFRGIGGHRGFYGGRAFAGRGYWGHRRYYGGYGGRYYGYGGPYYDDYDNGGAVAAGIVGLAAGAMIGSALSHHHYYGGSCAARFRTYNRATGTYVGYDGRRHHCP